MLKDYSQSFYIDTYFTLNGISYRSSWRPPTMGNCMRWNDYTFKRKENGVLDSNETKSYGFALLKPLKKHLKGSDTDNPCPINTERRASNV